VRGGLGPFTFDVDFDSDGIWNSAPAGRVVAIPNANILPEPVVPGFKSSLNVPIPASIPFSPPQYFIALRMTDSTLPADGGPFTSVIYWPFDLAPPEE
jgi:hypothetical protein